MYSLNNSLGTGNIRKIGIKGVDTAVFVPCCKNLCMYFVDFRNNIKKPEALKSLYCSPGYKKNQLVLCKNYVLQW